MTHFGVMKSVPITAVSDTSRLYRTLSDAEGKFFLNLPVGEYDLVASLPLTGIEKMRRVKVVRGATEIDINFGTECDGFALKTGLEAEDIRIVRNALLEALNRISTQEGMRLIISTANLPKQAVQEELRPDIVFRDDSVNKYGLNKKELAFRVSSLTVRTGCIGITLEHSATRSGGPFDGNVSGEGITLEYLKIGGKWIGRKVGAWVS